MKRRIIQVIFGYLLLIPFAILFLIPFLWSISTALKPLNQAFLFPPQWIPKPVMWENFVKGWKAAPFGRFFLNTTIITVLAVLGTVLSSSIVAYGFARLESFDKNILFILLLSTMMLPGQVTMIPIYILFKNLGWLNTFLPLIVPSWFGGGAFNIFLFRQFFLTIPKEFDDAAKVDGAGYFTIFWRIILPLSKPVLITITIFSIIYHWNDFLNPLIYLDKLEKFTIAIGLRYFQDNYQATQINLMMAVSLIALLPILILFLVAQRFFIKGIVLSGLKG
jgi:multiple sugar transport system permease protein